MIFADYFADLDEIMPMGYSATPRDEFVGEGPFRSAPKLLNENHG